jgi:hypothetical protein
MQIGDDKHPGAVLRRENHIVLVEIREPHRSRISGPIHEGPMRWYFDDDTGEALGLPNMRLVP